MYQSCQANKEKEPEDNGHIQEVSTLEEFTSVINVARYTLFAAAASAAFRVKSHSL